MIKLYRPTKSLTHVILPLYEKELTQLKKHGIWKRCGETAKTRRGED